MATKPLDLETLLKIWPGYEGAPDQLTPVAACAVVQWELNTLAADRLRKRRISYVKSGSRVLYPKVCVAEFLLANFHKGTA